MKPSYLNPLLIAAASFTIGFLIPSPFGSGPEVDPLDQSPAKNSRSDPGRGSNADENDTDRFQSSRRSGSSNPLEPGTLNLQRNVVEVLINSGEMERMLPEMGLTEIQTSKVNKIKTAAIKGLKRLEKKHAKLQSDDEGDYFVIEAFPEDRDLWLAGMVEELQDLVDDDRATVISRLIAQSDNDEETGLYRREIRTFKPKSPGADDSIIESVFDKNGGLIDQDVHSFQGENETRWEHLFKPEAE